MGIVTVIAAAVCLLNLASCHPGESLSEEVWPRTLVECFEEFKKSNFNGFCSTLQEFKQTFYDAFLEETGSTFQDFKQTFYDAFYEGTGLTFPVLNQAFYEETGQTFQSFYEAFYQTFYEETGRTFQDFYKAFYEKTGTGTITDNEATILAEATIFVVSLLEECSEETPKDMEPLFFKSICMDQECASFGSHLPSAEFSEYTTEMIMKELIHSFCWTE